MQQTGTGVYVVDSITRGIDEHRFADGEHRDDAQIGGIRRGTFRGAADNGYVYGRRAGAGRDENAVEERAVVQAAAVGPGLELGNPPALWVVVELAMDRLKAQGVINLIEKRLQLVAIQRGDGGFPRVVDSDRRPQLFLGNQPAGPFKLQHQRGVH